MLWGLAAHFGGPSVLLEIQRSSKGVQILVCLYACQVIEAWLTLRASSLRILIHLVRASFFLFLLPFCFYGKQRKRIHWCFVVSTPA
jgi:hypothetical protein